MKVVCGALFHSSFPDVGFVYGSLQPVDVFGIRLSHALCVCNSGRLDVNDLSNWIVVPMLPIESSVNRQKNHEQSSPRNQIWVYVIDHKDAFVEA